MSTPYNNEPNIDLPELPDGIYYPFKRLPGVMLVTYAYACIECALDYALEQEQSNKQAADSIAAYQALVKSWDLPGCRARIAEMAEYKEDFSTWRRALNEAVKKNEPLPDCASGGQQRGAEAPLGDVRTGEKGASAFPSGTSRRLYEGGSP